MVPTYRSALAAWIVLALAGGTVPALAAPPKWRPPAKPAAPAKPAPKPAAPIKPAAPKPAAAPINLDYSRSA